MQFEVAWAVTGTSYIDITMEDLVNAGVDIGVHSDVEAFRMVNKNLDGELLREAVEDWTERDAPTLTFVESMDYYNAQDGEEDSDG